MKIAWLFTPKAQLLGFCLGAVIVLAGTLAPAAELVPVPGNDKTHHILGFLGWAGLCALGPTRRFVAFAIVIALMGGLIELIQPYVNRHADWYDFWADTLGVALAFIVHGVACWIKARGTDSA
ncbi:hypothetical protein [Marinomonas ostreistagni]|uniref:hypothetical protein n=1 Tax=Marinomonas ostreistagni TaxID=359209 RepID=UPI0019521314|nr:hypothetical protein [Marinomonas ostreistagni]MBM6551897.1 hypothetical protein [Marinomonas ostreistagni]